MKKLKLSLVLFGVLISHAHADRTFKYPAVYPFVPYQVEQIKSAVKRITEDQNYISNLIDIEKAGLQSAETTVQPWGSTYWPLNKGLIADPYESNLLGYYVEMGTLSWTTNYKKFKGRLATVLANSDNLTSEQLNFLAPSEKYDLLLGDKSFDLTNRLWDFMQKWGNKKEFGFLSNLDITGENTLEAARMMVDNGWFESVADAFQNAYQLQGTLAPEIALKLVKAGEFEDVESAMPKAITLAIEEGSQYVLEKKNQYIAFWEGICHGWAVASGLVPRPRNTVEFTLPDKRVLKFYPTDIKALVSLMWANSLVQDGVFIDQNTGENIGGGVLSQGLRCNLENAKEDHWGRVYDHKADPFNGDHSPRCVGVHPAIWHLGLVNLIGKQGRSFVVERKVGEEVDNHPMHSYKMKYFHPNRGRSYKKLEDNIVEINKRDQFHMIRSPKAKYIVGVETKMTYLDWEHPVRYFNDSEANDDLVTKKMYYDLELDEHYNIVGGQWRAVKEGVPRQKEKLNHSQPDFFWVITKDYKKFFNELTDLEPWVDTTKAPPASWLARAHQAHEFTYQKKFKFGKGQKCRVFHTRKKESREVPCEFEEPRPQPLINLVNKLVELAQ